MSIQQSIRSLNSLYRIVEAGERGYAVCAANMDNPGLKILFKSYAGQRTKFKNEILVELNNLGGNLKPGSSFRGMLHRGRIDIFSALMITREERERIVLKEIIVGEKAALSAYEKTLKAELPAETAGLITQQYGQVCRQVDQIHLLRAKVGKHLLVELFNSEENVLAAIAKIQAASLTLESIERLNVFESLERYESRGTTVLETTISGAVGGAAWGSIIGALAATSMEAATSLVPFGAIQHPEIWSLVALAGILGGGLIGAMLGFVIGKGISEEDSYVYDQSRKIGGVLVLMVVDTSQSIEARSIMTAFSSM